MAPPSFDGKRWDQPSEENKPRLTHRKVFKVLRGSCCSSRVLWSMQGIRHRLHGLGMCMCIPPIRILVHLSSAKAPHPRTTMLF